MVGVGVVGRPRRLPLPLSKEKANSISGRCGPRCIYEKRLSAFAFSYLLHFSVFTPFQQSASHTCVVIVVVFALFPALHARVDTGDGRGETEY